MRLLILPVLLLSACAGLNAGSGAGNAVASSSPITSAMASASVQAATMPSPVPPLPSPGGHWTVDGHTISVWIASNDQTREQGLSGQPSLPADSGLVLYWTSPVAVKIWMPDMNFPLDVIFVSQNKVVTYYPDVPVCPSRDDCPEFGPNQPIDYVVEVPAGSAAKWGLKAGDAVQLTLP